MAEILPPGPKSPASWQLLRYSHSPLTFLEQSAQRYGDPFTVKFAGYGKFVMLASPDAVQDVFRGDPLSLHSGEGNEFLSTTVGANSVLVLDEQPHARQRRILLSPLKGERMRSFFNATQAATLEIVSHWPAGRPLTMVEPMRQITLRVILQAVLGLGTGPQLGEVERKVERLLKHGRGRYSLILVKLLPLALLQKVRWMPYFQQLRELDDLLYRIIDNRRQPPAADRGENVLADLLDAAHDDGERLSNQEIRDAVLTLLLAGHDTTSLALAWALEQIAAREDVMSEIAVELRRVTGGALPGPDDLNQLEYLDAAVRESLRIRTILPFVVRLVKKPFTAGGREYPPGVLLCPCNHLVHRREDLYPEPAKFRPERFIERRYAAHEWFPFGGGNRMCLGMAFALYEMKVVLSTLFSQIRVSRPPGSRSTAIRLGISLAPEDGAKVLITKSRTFPPATS